MSDATLTPDDAQSLAGPSPDALRRKRAEVHNPRLDYEGDPPRPATRVDERPGAARNPSRPASDQLSTLTMVALGLAFFSWVPWVALVTAPLAVIAGLLALARAPRGRRRERRVAIASVAIAVTSFAVLVAVLGLPALFT